MFWLALAAQLSLPVSVNTRLPDVRALFTGDDVPGYLIADGTSRIVYTRTTVAPDGTTQSCVAERSSGDAKLDVYTCQLITKRAKFAPAKWTDGTSVYGVIRMPISFVITNNPSIVGDLVLKATIPDLELSVNRLPKGAHSIAAVTLQIAADESGRPIQCFDMPILTKQDAKSRYSELVPIACRQVMTSLSLRPPVDLAGKPMRSVQTVSVHFKLDHR